MKRIHMAAIMLLAVLAGVIRPAAAEASMLPPDVERRGTITFEMKDSSGKTVPGGELAVYPAAELQETENGTELIYGNGFEQCRDWAEFLSLAAAAQKMSTYINKHMDCSKLRLSSDGKAVLSDLRPGLYLVIQTEAAAGYKAIEPFLITLPWEADGRWNYEVNAAPKMEAAVPETTVVPETSPEEIIRTGQLRWPIPVLGSMGAVMLVSGVGLLVTKKKSGKDSKDKKI